MTTAKPKPSDFGLDDPISPEEVMRARDSLLDQLTREWIRSERLRAFDQAMSVWRWAEGIDR